MTPTDIWNHDAINARTDAAMAAEPKRCETQIVDAGSGDCLSCNAANGQACLATPDQRQKAWEGE